MLKYFGQLLKFKLSITVVFSAIIGYLLGFDQFNLQHFIYLIFGGFLVTGSANAFNQILEKEKDKLMQRTVVRPLPQDNLSVLQAVIFAFIIGGIGLFLLNKINPQGSLYGVMSKSSFFGLISILLYVLSYTPLKRVSTISIFVGAIPGAIPFLLGYVAATDNFGLASGVLFAIQFFWQFPHFIAIAWVQHDDYKIPGLTLSIYGFIVVLLLGIWFTLKSIKLYQNTDDISARKLMLSSFAYLPLMQLVYVTDRFLT